MTPSPTYLIIIGSFLAPVLDFLVTMRYLSPTRPEVGPVAAKLMHHGLQPERALAVTMILMWLLMSVATAFHEPYSLGILTGLSLGAAFRNWLLGRRTTGDSS